MLSNKDLAALLKEAAYSLWSHARSEWSDYARNQEWEDWWEESEDRVLYDKLTKEAFDREMEGE